MPEYDQFRSLTRNNIKVELGHIGEGKFGDFDPDDTDDYPHLRFSVFKRDGEEWEELDDASYCTTLNAALSVKEMDIALGILMQAFYDKATAGKSVKKIGEKMSWIDTSDIEVWQRYDSCPELQSFHLFSLADILESY